jgi:hypothetical protein
MGFIAVVLLHYGCGRFARPMIRLICFFIIKAGLPGNGVGRHENQNGDTLTKVCIAATQKTVEFGILESNSAM